MRFFSAPLHKSLGWWILIGGISSAATLLFRWRQRARSSPAEIDLVEEASMESFPASDPPAFGR